MANEWVPSTANVVLARGVAGVLPGSMSQPSVELDSNVHTPHAGAPLELQLNVFLLQVYWHMLPMHAELVFGFGEQVPLASVQKPPAPSGAPHVAGPLQLGVLQAPWKQTWPAPQGDPSEALPFALQTGMPVEQA